MSRRYLSQLTGSIIFLVYFWYCIFTPTTWHFIDTVNLIFHEAGHSIFIFLPSIITALAGSCMQVAVPSICATYFYQRSEYTSASLLLLWVAQNLINVSLYARDAIPMNLTLLGGDSVTHDWNFIFTELHILNQSIFWANVLSGTAYLIAFLGTTHITLYFINSRHQSSYEQGILSK